MKDIEKIKSEDLACQVADANPGNFAIEQEVAQLVGATVPQPTEPSADDARELGAQLLVFLRRALLPIRSALRTALAAIYAHLDSRCTDYTPAAYAPYYAARRAYDPMGTLPARSVANLLTALTAFSARKISNGSAPNDGIKDGTSLAHLLETPSVVTELKDDNIGWTMVNSVSYRSIFAKCVKVTLGCSQMTVPFEYAGGYVFGSDCEYHLPNLKKITPSSAGGYGNGIFNGSVQTHDIYLPELEEIENGGFFGLIRLIGTTNLEPFVLYAPKLRKCPALFVRYNDSTLGITKVQLGKIESAFQPYYIYGSAVKTPNLIDWEFGQGTCANINLQYWNPTLTEANTATFLQNFKEHIALRLTSNGSGKTLTLSQAVFDTIWNQDGTPKSTDPDSVIYQINKIIKTDKHWSVNRA